MALFQCPECGGAVSETATQCPHCGYTPGNSPEANAGKTIISIIGAAIAIGFAIYMFSLIGEADKANKELDQAVQEMEQADREFQQSYQELEKSYQDFEREMNSNDW